ncbi:MAG: phosphate ABC transporter permease subunit PstC [Phycisphaerales bacterium]|nr:phosphate ABC transporter permease subunit PstC [Phycisphaerales bacterium]
MTTLATSNFAAMGRPRSRFMRGLSEFVVVWTLRGCAALSIFITGAIIVVLLNESLSFFTSSTEGVSLWGFLTGTEWTPLLGAKKQFGVLPLVSGTLLVTGIAAIFALPIGLLVAVYLSEYAPSRVRTWLKAMLEVLAGVPTVVYGFFALTYISPHILQNLPLGVGERFGTYSAMAGGLAVGIMVLPIVCSLSEDALRAVPRALRDGAYALGATKFDVSVKVVVPAALSGVMAAFLLAITRAIGETMIVALAAGGLAHLTADPSQQVQTMTAYMVQIFLGDATSEGIEYKSSYAVATTLFAITMIMTCMGGMILRRFREEYE